MTSMGAYCSPNVRKWAEPVDNKWEPILLIKEPGNVNHDRFGHVASKWKAYLKLINEMYLENQNNI